MNAPERVNTMSPRERLVLRLFAIWTVGFLLLLVVTMLLRRNVFGQPATPAENDIHIVVQAPLSGQQADMGREIRNGVELAMADAGAPLAQQGFMLSLVAYDDQAQPDVAVTHAEQIGRDPAALAIIGHINGGEAAPAAERYARTGLLFVTPASGSPLVATGVYSNVNRLLGRNDGQAAALARFAESELHAHTIFIVNAQTLYGVSLSQSFVDLASSHNLVISGTALLSAPDSPAAAAAAIAAAAPDAILYGGEPDGLVLLLDALQTAQITTTIMAGDGANAPILAEAVARTGATVYYTTLALPPADYSAQYPAAEAFVTQYQARYGSGPGLYAAEAYDATRLVLAAIERSVGDREGIRPTRTQVSRAMRQVSLYGLQGRYLRLVSGELAEAAYFVLKLEALNAAGWNHNSVAASYWLSPPTP